MTDDIVERLRSIPFGDDEAAWSAVADAADEIERLRDQVRWASDRASEWKLETYELNTEIERLLAAGNQLADYVREAGPGLHDDMAVLACWQEARRGDR